MITFLLIWIALIVLVQFIYSDTFEKGLSSIRMVIGTIQLERKLKKMYQEKGRIATLKYHKELYPEIGLFDTVRYIDKLCFKLKRKAL